MKCPRYYFYSMIEGYRGTNVDVEFGGYFATGTETFKKAKLEGKTNQEATIETVQRLLRATYPGTYDSEGYRYDGVPWGGRYEELWRCTGTEPYRNAKGNRAKCPWSHAGKHFPAPAPEQCGSCGSPTEVQRLWISDNPAKDRITLIRAIVGWCDEQVENISDGVYPTRFPDGTPAVELSFKFPLPFKTSWGEPYILAGHLDSIDAFGEENLISDQKTTKNALSPRYWAQFAPHVQVDTYDLTGSILYPDLAIKGVRIDGIQTLVGGARFGSHVFYHTEAQREELLHELGWYLKQAERYAEEDYWPMNRSACYGCPYNGACSKDPSKRKMYLDANFQKRQWNPLEER